MEKEIFSPEQLREINERYHKGETLDPLEKDAIYQDYKKSVSEPVSRIMFWMDRNSDGTRFAGNPKPPEKIYDPVNRPPHYTAHKFDVIDMMEMIYGQEVVKHFCMGNAFKYRMRAGLKGDNIEEEIKKAMWYENKLKQLENGNNTIPQT